jgi:hypothetical protein
MGAKTIEVKASHLSLPWRFADAGPGVRGAVIMGRHPKTFTKERHRLDHDPSAQVAGIVN